MNIEQAEEMVEALQNDSMIGVDSLGGYGEDVAIALHKELLTTRRQLEIARSELNAIATQDDIEMVLDPTWAKRIAEHAIDAINKEGEMNEQ